MEKMNDYRYKLIKTFWYTAKQAGVREENARDFVQSVYPGKRLSTMTVDELERVVKKFINTTSVDVSMPRKKRTLRKYKNNQLEMASGRQIKLIDMYAEALGMDDFHLEALMYRVGGRFGEPMTLIVAQKMIEALKNMIKRGWKPKIKKTYNYENVTWN